MHNLFLLLGTIIGAGIFSLPIVLGKAGSLAFIVLTVGLGFLMAKVNWFYRQVVESVHERHQLPGYVKHILGPKFSLLATLSLLFSTVGALLAYLILSGEFLAKISPLSASQGSWLFYVAVFIMLYFGGRNLEALDVFMTVVKVMLLVVVIVISLNPTNFTANLLYQPGVFSFKGILLAYGSVLFALTGFSIVPELKKDEGMKRSINLAQIISASIYLFFSLNMLSFVKGESFVLSGTMANALFNLAGVFGVLTPYLMLSWVCYDLLDKDLGFPKKEALVLTLVIPLLLYLVGLHDFMAVISVSGGLFLGIIAILIARMYAKKFPGKNRWLIYTIQGVFALGAVAEIISLF